MPKVDVHNLNKEKVGTLQLDDSVFGATVKEHLFYEVVRSQMAGRRAGTHKTKTRANVAGSTRKPFKQKGTGRARQGDCKVPIHVGGGVAHGPLPRNYGYKVPKKVRKAAVRSALTRRLNEERLWVVEDFQLERIKTKDVVEICDRFGWDNVLLIDERNDALGKSARNLQKVQYLVREGVNCYDLLRYNNIVLTKSAVEHITGVFGNE